MSKHLDSNIIIPIEKDNPSIRRNTDLCIKCGQCEKVCEEKVAVGGVIKIRENLTPFLLKLGGNIGYCVAKEHRRKGYGKKILSLGLEKTRDIGMEKVFITWNFNL